jgi:alkaline phosphatase D
MASIERRAFLKASLASATSVVLMPACGTDEDTGTQAPSPYFPQSVASGDPKPSSVILWTRVDDPAHPSDDLALVLEVATDERFSRRVTFDGVERMELNAEAEFDHCVKVRATGLEPGTVYYFRFLYEADGGREISRTGRTKTAPLPDADVAVHFAVASCQDYSGKYYHAYRRMAEMDLDFLVHLGDYVYETADDPSFQTADPERSIGFEDGQSLVIERNGGTFEAARSLDNYRTLYRTYRSDADLQSAHERIPIVAVWDDHEFSDDCHGAVATYLDGREDETDVARRTAADQAWFEYMPVDYEDDTASAFDPQTPFPDNIVIYRDLSFGRHVHLVMTDLRHYRADHLVDEAAFPGAVAVTQAEIETLLGVGNLPAFALPYVDIDVFSGGAYRDALQGSAAQHGFSADRITGLIGAGWINQVLLTLTASASLPAPIDETDPSLERGVVFHQLLKTEEFSSVGSRMLLRRRPFELYARHRFEQSAGASESMMGQTQEDWFVATMQSSAHTWKFWGNELGFMRRQIDLRNFALAPPDFQDEFLLNGEDWDGFPNRRDELLAALAGVGNVVSLGGDLHSFFVGTPFANDDPNSRVVEFIAGSISSTPLMEVLGQAVASGALTSTGVAPLVLLLPALLTDAASRPNPHLAFLDLSRNGFASFSAGAQQLEATLHIIHPDAVGKPAPANLDGEWSTERFRVDVGTLELFRWTDDEWRRWDVAAYAWL